VCATLHVRNA